MERYTWIEMADMHLAYGATFTSGRAAHRLYRDRYPNRHHTTFSSIHRRLCQSRTVHRRVDGQGQGRFVQTPEAEEAVLQYVGNNPSASTRESRYRTALSRVMSQSGEFCRKCCYVRTTLKEFMFLYFCN